MKRLALLVLMFPIVAVGDPEPWMKKENPNELGVFVFVTKRCPMTDSELRELLEGVLVRSRIKPVSWVAGDIYLDVDLDCTQSQSSNHVIFNFVIDFTGVALLEGKGNVPVRFGKFKSGGVFGSASLNEAKQAMKVQIESVITDYLQANFDLGEDE